MMNNSQAIYHLQKTHDELVKISTLIVGFKKAIEDDSATRLAEITLRASRGTLLKNEQEQKKLDADSAALSTKIREDETRLYNGKVRSPKEMIELQNEIAHQRSRLITLEENSFECLTANEKLSADVAKAESDLATIRSSHSAKIEKLHRENDAAAEKMTKMQTAYADQRAMCSAELLAHFDRLLLSKNNIAVALIDEDCCGVCGTQLSKQVVLSSRSAENPNVCPTCNRMLFNEH